MILIMGGVVTAVGIAFVLYNLKQRRALAKINAELEQKNYDLEDQINERENLNFVLRQSENEHRLIIDAVSDIIFEVTDEGEIVFLNAAWTTITGFDTNQFLGKEFFSVLHPQDQELHRREFDLMLRGQRQNIRALTRIIAENTQYRTVEMTLSLIRQESEKDLRVVGTFTDIEERRRAEKALSEAEKKYRTIVENAAGGIFQLTPEGLYLSANPALARILGYESPEDILRFVHNANDDVYGDAAARIEFNRLLEDKGEVLGHETEVIRGDGQRIWVNESIRTVKDDSGHVLYYEGSMEDITERKSAAIDLASAKLHSDLANRAKSEFLANMSHELRTPLNSIIGFSEIIKDEVFGPLEQRQYWEYAKDIHESGSRLLTIINEILDISKIEAGERQLNEGTVDLDKVVSSCVALMSEKITNGKLTVKQECAEAPTLVAEELSIKQIIMNLLSNAIKFTPENGSVTIAVKVSHDGQMILSFTDTGIGLEEDEIQKALSPFGQVDTKHSRSGSGTGLGLTLVKSLTEIHGGELEMLSEKGIGTTVNVIFPAQRVSKSKGDSDLPDNVVNLKSQ